MPSKRPTKKSADSRSNRAKSRPPESNKTVKKTKVAAFDPSSPRFLNRELAWLEFNARVLDQAIDAKVHLLERAKFLAITGSNLDEFFMVRVGSLKLQSNGNSGRRDPAGLTAPEQLLEVARRCQRHVQSQYACLQKKIQPELTRERIHRVDLNDCSDRLVAAAERHFRGDVVAVLSPQALHDRRFPMLPGLGIHLCVELRSTAELSAQNLTKVILSDDERKALEQSGDSLNAKNVATAKTEIDAEPQFAVIPLGKTLPRVVPLPSDRPMRGDAGAENSRSEVSELGESSAEMATSDAEFNYVLLEDLVTHFVDEFFPGREVVQCKPFRITRNADVELREDGAGDLLGGMEEVLESRRLSDVVRLEMDASSSDAIRNYLIESFYVDPDFVFQIDGPLDLTYLFTLNGLPGFDGLRDEAWPPQRSEAIDPNESMFSAIAERDIMLMHPFETFDPVVRLIEEAATDPDVLAVKQILYRTSRNSPIVAALMRAAERGKYVTAIVELKARFDEARNIEWAREMEQAGVQVIYGIRGLKTHAKVCIIVRREPRGLVRYMHFGTGNYNEVTAKLYGDISLLTCNATLGTDATMFFNAVTGASRPQPLQQLAIAPLTLRHRLLELIRGETKRSQQGQKAEIVAKLNALVDTEMIEALYTASQAGVKIRLNVRGVCCLRPGIPGLSDSIEVVSIVDRFLEHARIIYFRHGGDHELYISSADWMPRNLDRRIELLVPVIDAKIRKRLRDTLDLYFLDNQNAWNMQADGSYERLIAGKKQTPLRSQAKLYAATVKAIKESANRAHVTFEPHRPQA